MQSAKNLLTATKGVPRARILMKSQSVCIIFRGDSENRSPGADFGLPKAENQNFKFSSDFRPKGVQIFFRFDVTPARPG